MPVPFDFSVNGAFSELYHANSGATGDNNSSYDSLNRLTSFRRGTLTSSGNNGTNLDTITTANLNSSTGVPNADSWSLDAIGNWNSSAPGGTTVSNSFNSKNEETANGSSSLTFDANGNMLTDGSGLTYHYDGWNRLVQVTDAGSTVEMSRSYDALGRADVYNSPASGYLDWYYSTQNQCVEEQAGSSYVQYVWGLGYQNQLVLRDRNVSGSGNLGKTGSGLSERLYVQQDANYNVISLTSQTGSTIIGRMVYDPYGTATFLTSSWASGSNGTAWVYTFQGGRQEGAGNLIIFGARLYDAVLGRWTTADPSGYNDGCDLYVSFDCNPAALVDPSGLRSSSRGASLEDVGSVSSGGGDPLFGGGAWAQPALGPYNPWHLDLSGGSGGTTSGGAKCGCNPDISSLLDNPPPGLRRFLKDVYDGRYGPGPISGPSLFPPPTTPGPGDRRGGGAVGGGGGSRSAKPGDLLKQFNPLNFRVCDDCTVKVEPDWNPKDWFGGKKKMLIKIQLTCKY